MISDRRNISLSKTTLLVFGLVLSPEEDLKFLVILMPGEQNDYILKEDDFYATGLFRYYEKLNLGLNRIKWNILHRKYLEATLKNTWKKNQSEKN